MKKSMFLMLVALAVTTFGAVSGYAQTGRASVSAAEVNGTVTKYFTGKYKGSSSEIKILTLGGGKLHIAMSLIYPYTMPNGDLIANTGELDGQAAIKGDTAVFESDDSGTCKITIKFVRAGKISVSQDGTDADCGFGHNVMADGNYTKTSSKKPKFDTQN